MAAATLALLTATITAQAKGPETWVPMRWQGGPLELWRRTQSGEPSPAPDIATIIRDAYTARSLDLIRNTPVDCFLVTWSAGAKKDLEAEQRRLVTSYVESAHARGIAIVGLLYPGADVTAAIQSGLAAGLDGFALDGWNSGSASSLLTESARPVIRIAPGDPPAVHAISDSVAATPTTEPWIDFNTWVVHSLRTYERQRPVWLGYRFTDASDADYVRAISDAAAAGGRWIIGLEDTLRAALWRGDPRANSTWARIASTLAFYEAHSEWRTRPATAALAVVRERSAGESEMAAETLKLIARRRIPYRVIDRTAVGRQSFEGVSAVLAAGLTKATADECRALAAFAGTGGLVIAGPSWGCGSVQTIVCKEDPPDPEVLSKEVLSLLGKENLPVRIFNASSVLPYITEVPGSSLLVHLVNYATEPAERVTVRAAGGRYRTARLFRPEGAPVNLQVETSGDRAEVLIPNLAVSAAVLFEK